MNRYNQLKQFKDEVHRLFANGTNESTAFDILHADQRFTNISRTQLQAIYKHLNEQAEAKTEFERQVLEKEKQIAENKSQLEEFKREFAGTEDQVLESAAYVKLLSKGDQYKRKLADLKRINDYHPIATKSLIHEGSFFDPIYVRSIWHGRYFLTKNYDGEFTLHDLFQNIEEPFVGLEFTDIHYVHELAYPFVLTDGLFEFDTLRMNCFFLAKIDPEKCDLQVVESLGLEDDCVALVDQCNLSKFILTKQFGNKVEIYNLVNGHAQIDKAIELEGVFDFRCASYFDEKIFGLKFDLDENRQEIVKSILVYDLETKERKTFKLDILPEGVRFADSDDDFYHFKWLRDRIFASVEFCLTDEYGVAFAEPQTRAWIILQFATNSPIKGIQFTHDQSLMIYTEEEEKYEEWKRKFYKLPMHKPDLLRNMAWKKVVNMFKSSKVDNPYDEARNCLPYNSDIRSSSEDCLTSFIRYDLIPRMMAVLDDEL